MKRLKRLKRRHSFKNVADVRRFFSKLWADKPRFFRYTSIIATVALVSGFFVFASSSSQATSQIVPSTFTGPSNGITEATSNNWVIGGSRTGGTWSPIMVDGPDVDSNVDRLQLVNRQTNEVGFALYDVAQTTSAGLDVRFNIAMYDGGGSNTNPADGISFYLKDGNDSGNTADSLGARCDGLGYAARQSNDACRNNGNFGLSGGLLGIGFDAWGDAYASSWDGVGCNPASPTYAGTFPQKLIIRGPQGNTRSDGYCRIFTPQDGTNAGVNTGISLTNNSMFTSAGSAVRITVDTQDQSGGRNNGTARIYIAAAGTTNWSNVTETTVFELPEALAQANTFKFGFTAGTGGNFMRGEIWDASVESIRDLPPPTWTSIETMCSVSNVSFTQQMQVVDGVAPYTFNLQSGTLPPGLALSSAGVLSGTPSTIGTYTFTLRATDSSIGSALTADRTFTMTIQENECSTISVSMANSRQITSASTDFNFENRITLPGSWSSSQYIAAEVALTAEDSDSAQTYRGPGSCGIDISSSTTSGTYGTTQSNGTGQITGASNVWVMNDRTSQLTLYGPADSVRQALKNVRAYCASIDDLNGKYVRLGAVPTESPRSVNISDSGTNNVDIGLFYVFSTQHYYTFNRNGSTPAQGGTWATNFTRIGQMFENARYQNISVDGQYINVSGNNTRKGWVATLISQDEIVLSEAFRPPSAPTMIGVTDVGTTTTSFSGNNNQPDSDASTWTWDTTRWGTMPTTQNGQSLNSSCTTKEGNYRWLGPDAWCQQVPAPQGTQRQLWKLDGNTGLWSVGTANDRTIDFGSGNSDCSLDPCNGYGRYHMWHAPRGTNGTDNLLTAVTNEPNQSGDFIYSGYEGPQWDDAGPADGYEVSGALAPASVAIQYYFTEYCAPANPCTPADSAVASTLLTAVDTSIRLSWEFNGANPTAPSGAAQDATCTNGTVSQRTVGSYRTVQLTSSGLGTATCTWTAPTGVKNVEVFLVGGGGGGGGNAGAGGGGGSQTLHSSYAIDSTASITVGGGGAGGSSSGAGATGTASSFTSNSMTVSASGGNGGAANSSSATSGGAAATTNRTLSAAGASGGNGGSSPSNGSNGSAWQNAGSLRTFGGGGAGGGNSQVRSGGTGGGASSTASGTPANATANTGGGGAGGNNNTAGGRGASGIVVIKYSLPDATNSPTVNLSLAISTNNSITTAATVKRQYTTLTDSTCGTSWTTEAANITSFPNSTALERGRCYRWTVDSGLATGAVRPIDSASATPTTNLTSPVVLIPNEASISTATTVNVDPRNSHVNLAPLLPSSSGPPRLQVCLYQYGDGANALTGIGSVASTPSVDFDLGTAGSVQTSLNGATVDGDRTSSVSIVGTSQEVQDALESIRVNATSGRLNSSTYILLRTVPVISGFTSTCGESGAQLAAQSTGVQIVEIKPLQIGTKKDVEIRVN